MLTSPNGPFRTLGNHHWFLQHECIHTIHFPSNAYGYMYDIILDRCMCKHNLCSGASLLLTSENQHDQS